MESFKEQSCLLYEAISPPPSIIHHIPSFTILMLLLTFMQETKKVLLVHINNQDPLTFEPSFHEPPLNASPFDIIHLFPLFPISLLSFNAKNRETFSSSPSFSSTTMKTLCYTPISLLYFSCFVLLDPSQL